MQGTGIKRGRRDNMRVRLVINGAPSNATGGQGSRGTRVCKLQNKSKTSQVCCSWCVFWGVGGVFRRPGLPTSLLLPRRPDFLGRNGRKATERWRNNDTILVRRPSWRRACENNLHLLVVRPSPTPPGGRPDQLLPALTNSKLPPSPLY